VNPSTVVVAGASGKLGSRIVRSLNERGARVVALVRAGADREKVEPLERLGAKVTQVDLDSVARVAEACAGASCVVSALLGLREVMVDAQTILLEGAIKAGVPRFIPSDYAMDFNHLSPGSNRNLDLHREFQDRLDRSNIRATSILNGAFMELLTGQAPFILFKRKRVLYWGNADQILDFTTMDDTAAYTAAAALDAETPRFLRIAGQQVTARELTQIASEVTHQPYRLTRAGGLGLLNAMIKVMRTLMPAPRNTFPPWQGMQYMHNMFEGKAVLKPLDNARYPNLKWTQVREVLSAHVARA
jgi:uncharacterized protein YbjT (DUF2867 family)